MPHPDPNTTVSARGTLLGVRKWLAPMNSTTSLWRALPHAAWRLNRDPQDLVEDPLGGLPIFTLKLHDSDGAFHYQPMVLTSDDTRAAIQTLDSLLEVVYSASAALRTLLTVQERAEAQEE